MPGVPTTPLEASGDEAEGDAEPAEAIPLLLPSRLEPENRNRSCLHQVAEHERLLRMAQLQDSLIELRHTRKIRHKLLLNHNVQIAGQGQRASTRSRAILESVEDRITKYVERYRIARQALFRLDPTGDWTKTYLELNDCDNRGPGKERDEERASNGKYFRSWIWLSNPQAALHAKVRADGDADKGRAGAAGAGEEEDSINEVGGGSADNDKAGEGAATEKEVDDDGEAEVETATQEEVDEVVRVEWTTSYARLARWVEEVELLQEEMRRAVTFLEWKSRGWLTRADSRGEDLTFDIRSGLKAYAQKQAAVYHNLAISFTKSWYPTLESYSLEHSWAVDYMKEHNIPLPVIDDVTSSREQGIFKFRLSDKSRKTVPPATPPSSQLPAVATTPIDHRPLAVSANSVNNPLSAAVTVPVDCPPLEEAACSDSGSGFESDYVSESDWDDDDDY